MKFKIKNITVLLLVLTSAFSQAQTKFENGTWDQIKQKAASENKLIFVDLYFTGCAPCAQMDAQVFPNKKVFEVLNNDFVPFKSDIFKEDIGKKLSLKYAVTGFPSFLFLNAEGKIIDITSGYHTVDEFTNLLSSIKTEAGNNNYKNYSKNLEGDYPGFYVDSYMEGKRNISFETIDAYLKTQNDLGSEIPFIVMSGLRAGGIYGDFILKNSEKLAEDYSRMQVRNSLITVIGRKAKVFGKEGNRKEFDAVLDLAKPVFTDEEWSKFSVIFQENYTKNNI